MSPVPPRPIPSMSIVTRHGMLPLQVTAPAGGGPWPGVVVLHDIAGMTADVVQQCDWLAGEGFLAAAPDLMRGGRIARCLLDAVRNYTAWEGSIYEQVEDVRGYLAGRADCTGSIGVVGFCLGGGFALGLAPRGVFDVAGANYGRVPKDAQTVLAGACPVVASYGGRDRSLRGAASDLRTALAAVGVPHDVKEYPGAGHAFMNHHGPGEMPFVFQLLGRYSNAGHDQASAHDARGRLVDFFRTHLG